MITLYNFGPAFGLPDPSPFVTKVEVLLKMAGLAYTVQTGGFSKAPKGKLPFIDDDGETIADSTFIRSHLEVSVRFRPRAHQQQRATAWAFEKMLEEHPYWTVLHARWMDDANFVKGSRHLFRAVPAPIRPFVLATTRRHIRRALYGQGIDRHSDEEIVALGTRSIDAIADFLEANPFMGAPSRRDSTPRPSPSSPARCVQCSRLRCAPRPSVTTISGDMSGG